MSRPINSDTIAELAKDSFIMAHLVKIDFEIAVFLTECPQNLVYSGDTYNSSSALKGISSVTETSEVQVGAVSITLSGVSQEYISILLSQTYIDRQVTISRVLLSNSYSIIGAPILIYDGRIQSFSISDNDDTSTIVISASSHWADFDKKAGRRTNHNSQQIYFPGDLGFEFAANTVKDLKWGRA